MMEYSSWRKKPPTPEFRSFCNAYRLERLAIEKEISIPEKLITTNDDDNDQLDDVDVDVQSQIIGETESVPNDEITPAVKRTKDDPCLLSTTSAITTKTIMVEKSISPTITTTSMKTAVAAQLTHPTTTTTTTSIGGNNVPPSSTLSDGKRQQTPLTGEYMTTPQQLQQQQQQQQLQSLTSSTTTTTALSSLPLSLAQKSKEQQSMPKLEMVSK